MEIAKETTQERFYKMAREAGEYAKEHPELGPVEREPIGKVLWEGFKGAVGRRYEKLKGEVLGLPEELHRAGLDPEQALENVLAFMPFGMTKTTFVKQLGKSFKEQVARPGPEVGREFTIRRLVGMRARTELKPMLRQAKTLPEEMYRSVEEVKGVHDPEVDWSAVAGIKVGHEFGGLPDVKVPITFNWRRILKGHTVTEEVAHTTQFAPELFWGKRIPKKVEALRMDAIRLRNYIERQFSKKTAYDIDPIETGLGLFKEVAESKAKAGLPMTFGEAKNLYIQSLKWGIADAETALVKIKKLEMGP